MDGAVQWRVGDPAPPPLPRRSEADVVAKWQDGPPLVSVLCPTYQHVGFIEDALRGFLGQDTDFPFEIIVRDDASTDGTAEIVRDYAERYSSIVRAILEPRNEFARVKPLAVLMTQARGALHAPCEGDDYWIEPRKLATQAMVLRRDAGVALTTHATIRIRDGVIERGVAPVSPDRLSRQHVLRYGAGVPCALMFRSEVDPAVEFSAHVTNGDDFLGVRSAMLGETHYDRELLPAVQRTHAGGIWSLRPARSRNAAASTSALWTGAYLADRGWQPEAEHWFARSARIAVWEAERSGVDVRLPLIVALAREWSGARARSAVRRIARILGIRATR